MLATTDLWWGANKFTYWHNGVSDPWDGPLGVTVPDGVDIEPFPSRWVTNKRQFGAEWYMLVYSSWWFLDTSRIPIDPVWNKPVNTWYSRAFAEMHR